MPGGIDRVTGIYGKQDHTDRQQDLRGDLADQIVNDRGKQIYYGNASQAEDDQSFRTDPAVDVQIIVIIVPPLFSSMGHLQVDCGPVFHHTCQNDGHEKLQPGFFTEPVQKEQDHCSTRSVDRQPGSVKNTAVDKFPVFDQMETDLPGPADKAEKEEDDDDRQDGIAAKIPQVLG